jgi:putative tricarboxylic transport membrane protein
VTATALRTTEDDGPRATSRRREVGLGVVFLAVGTLVLALAHAIELPDRALSVSPRIWPEALGVGIMALSVLQIVRSFVRPAADDDDLEPTTRVGRLRVVGFVLAVVAFGPLWYFVHFLVSATLLVAALTWIAGGRGLKDLLLFPVGITVLLYGLFALLLKVPV